MSAQPNYDACDTWQDIVAEHRRTLQLPPSTVCTDAKLTEWKERANAVLEPPSSDVPGPALAQLVQNEPTKTIWASELDALLDGRDASAIAELTTSGKVSVVAVTQHFVKKASVVHQATNCLAQMLADDALQRAEQLDEKRSRFEADGRLHELGALFGVPMSIKGHIPYNRFGNQRGFVFDVLPDPTSHPLVKRNLTQEQLELLKDTQGGYVSERPNAHLVELLLDADAVIICKTTMPQGVMHLDTTSNLYGQTLNPHNLALSPGGSSGGESAIIAGGGVALGVGSDIGGSIRQPCAVTGLYGLRPTTQRIPYGGVRSTMPGAEGVGSSIGPMAKSFRDIERFMASMLNDKTRPWEREHFTLPMPWRKVDSLLKGGQKTLVVGVMMEDGVVRPTTPVRRALGHWVDKLRAKGGLRVELRRWEPRDLHRRAWDIVRSLYFMESGKYFHLLSRATGEPLLPLTQFILAEPFVRSAEADLAADAAGEARKQDEMSASDVMASVRVREAFRAEYLRAWNELGLDCLLCPATANVAPRPSTVKYWNYTSVFNLVDYPGVVFPSGITADSALDREFEAKSPKAVDGFEYETRREGEWMGEFDEDNAREYEQHREVFNGAPVGLQLIGRRYKDEELVKYAELLDHIVRS